MGKRRAPLVPGDNPKLGDQLRYKVARAELDLHGKTAAQAERAVLAFLQRVTRSHPGEVVRIITGRGSSSTGVPVLGPALEQQLRELRTFVAEWQPALDRGSYLVRLN